MDKTDQALAALQNVIQAHPKSGVAWYLLAEAYDARNDEANAATALNMAERSAPGLPFANAQEVANLKAHINGAQPHSGNSSHTIMFVIGGVILLVILLRFLPGRGMASRNYGYTRPAAAARHTAIWLRLRPTNRRRHRQRPDRRSRRGCGLRRRRTHHRRHDRPTRRRPDVRPQPANRPGCLARRRPPRQPRLGRHRYAER